MLRQGLAGGVAAGFEQEAEELDCLTAAARATRGIRFTSKKTFFIRHLKNRI